MPSDKIYLDVGGRIFVTTKLTLCSREEGSYFSRMFQSDWKESECNGPEDAIFIDHDPDTFALVLDYLRYGEVKIPGELFWKLKATAEYFKFEGLLLYIEKHEKEIHFQCSNGMVPHHSASYHNIVEHCEYNSKFMFWLNTQINQGNGMSGKKGIALSFCKREQGDPCCTFCISLIEWLNVGFFSKMQEGNQRLILHKLKALELKRAAKEFAQVNSINYT